MVVGDEGGRFGLRVVLGWLVVLDAGDGVRLERIRIVRRGGVRVEK
jgi:hypothetical protein